MTCKDIQSELARARPGAFVLRPCLFLVADDFADNLQAEMITYGGLDSSWKESL